MEADVAEGVAPYPAISDYAIVGNSRAAALISLAGSIDWLCLPRFDSPSIFAALLDNRDGGRFQISPAGRFESKRSYIGNTPVLRTVFTSLSGTLQLTDLMSVSSETDRQRMPRPDHQILRIVECTSGEVEVEVRYDPRPDYGRQRPKFIDRGPLGTSLEFNGHLLTLTSEIPLEPAGGQPGLTGRVTLTAGERRALSLVSNRYEPAVIPPLGDFAQAVLEQTLGWWEEWAGQIEFAGPYRQAVIRSALTLKLMTFAPSGAVVAAPTTSLPEAIGGVRNWDYRFCWLRDASLTLRALFEIGCRLEGDAFLAWLLHATRLTWPELQILYDVYGETRLPEIELDHLEGYRSSRPVRVGNAAADQLQLDVYGEVIDAAYQFAIRGGRFDRRTGRLLVGLGETVCRRWDEPDEGIWETRAGRRHHTFSKAMCWVALDRLIRMQEAGWIMAPVERFRRQREAIREEIEQHGYNEAIQSYVSEFGGDEVDASLLLLGIYGYQELSSPRMRATFERIQERLSKNGLLYRYHEADGLPSGEGAFGICSFWAVECRALLGDIDGARALFEHLLSFGNDVGLFAEEIDPNDGAALGNFPQAFTHVGLINAALTLAQHGRQENEHALTPHEGAKESTI